MASPSIISWPGASTTPFTFKTTSPISSAPTAVPAGAVFSFSSPTISKPIPIPFAPATSPSITSNNAMNENDSSFVGSTGNKPKNKNTTKKNKMNSPAVVANKKNKNKNLTKKNKSNSSAAFANKKNTLYTPGIKKFITPEALIDLLDQIVKINIVDLQKKDPLYYNPSRLVFLIKEDLRKKKKNIDFEISEKTMEKVLLHSQTAQGIDDLWEEILDTKKIMKHYMSTLNTYTPALYGIKELNKDNTYYKNLTEELISKLQQAKDKVDKYYLKNKNKEITNIDSMIKILTDKWKEYESKSRKVWHNMRAYESKYSKPKQKTLPSSMLSSPHFGYKGPSTTSYPGELLIDVLGKGYTPPESMYIPPSNQFPYGYHTYIEG